MFTYNNDHEHDRISALPDEVLHDILSFLPTELAIKTSILSSRWRHLWKWSPVIDFPSWPSSWDQAEDYSFVDRILDLHEAPKLRKFSMEVRVHPETNPDVVKWIDFAITRHVQVLSVAVEVLTNFVNMPRSLYLHNNIQSLEQMFLTFFHFDSPKLDSMRTFASLKTLSISESVIERATFNGLMTKCPVLESLSIDCCYGIRDVKIYGSINRWLKQLSFRHPDFWRSLILEVDVPNLVSLRYCGNLMKIHLGNLPCVIEAILFHEARDNKIDYEYVMTLISKLTDVRRLGVDSWFPQLILEGCYMNGSGGANFQNLKEFCWFGPLAKEHDLLALLAFLGNCPCLEKIEIDFRDKYWDGFDNDVNLYIKEHPFVELKGEEEEAHIECLHQLKTVEGRYFSGYRSEMELVKRLLKKAVVLETFSLNFEGPPKSGQENAIWSKEVVREELFRLSRASSLAQIIFC